MADGDGQQTRDVRPTPDPTVLTTEALARGLTSERDYVDGRIAVLEERLRAIDVATRLLNETVNRVPTDVQREVTHLTSLFEEKFVSTKTQFSERDARGERESRDNKLAVDAAFAAQEKQAAAAAKANAEALGKSETAMDERVKTLSELFQTSVRGISDKIDDLKERLGRVEERVGRIESAKQGAAETRTETRLNLGQIILAASVIIAAIGLILAFKR